MSAYRGIEIYLYHLHKSHVKVNQRLQQKTGHIELNRRESGGTALNTLAQDTTSWIENQYLSLYDQQLMNVTSWN